VALREVLAYPDRRLNLVANLVGAVDATDRKLLDDMTETMYQHDGIGLAAPQLGESLRLVVVDCSEQLLQLVNPRVVVRSGETTKLEGCLSLPGFYEEVSRAEQIQVEARSRSGELLSLELEGLEAACVQHEIDHLQGRLFVEHLSRLKRQRLLKKFSKQQRELLRKEAQVN